MKRIAFKMQLYAGYEEEYKRRHDEIWPELKDLLKQAGVSGYSIFLDKETHSLFGVFTTSDEQAPDRLPMQPVMQQWWAYMKDIMETNADHSPVSIPLQEVFFLP